VKRLLLLLAACGGDPTPQAPPRPVHADARLAATADASPQRFTGVLSAAEVVDITPRVAGVIAKVTVGAGDRVEAGQIVAEMDPMQLREELRAAEAALAAASAATRQAAVDVEDARRKLVLETKAVASGVSAQTQLDEARLGVKRAEAAVERAHSSQAAEAARAQNAKDQLTNSGLKAPFAGTVEKRYRDAGNRVEAGQPIVRIVGHGKMRLRFAVPPELVKRVPVGAAVTATIDTIAHSIPATVKQVSPAVDPASGLILVEAELNDAQAELRTGLAAWVEPPSR
jgi:RND family efflux transporter MFP subunit